METIKNYTYEDTKDENIKRLVDRRGDWKYYWIVDEGVFKVAVNHVLHVGYAKGKRFHDYLLSVTKEEAREKLEKTGEEGSRTHQAINDLIAGIEVKKNTVYLDQRTNTQESLTDDEWDNLLAFQRFCEMYKPRIVDYDYPVHSSKGYAGTPDALIVITVPDKDKTFYKEMWGKDVLVLVDWKTSQAIYDEYKAQTGAYYVADREHGAYENFYTEYKDRIFTGVLRLGTRHKIGFEFEVWNEVQTLHHFNLFISAKRIQFEADGAFTLEITELPSAIKIEFAKPVIEVKEKKVKVKRKPRVKKKLKTRTK